MADDCIMGVKGYVHGSKSHIITLSHFTCMHIMKDAYYKITSIVGNYKHSDYRAHAVYL